MVKLIGREALGILFHLFPTPFSGASKLVVNIY